MAMQPKSSAVVESLCALAGMLLATAIGFQLVPACFPHGWILTALGIAASVALLPILALAESIIGNFLGRL
jgi:hypothetical protein